MLNAVVLTHMNTSPCTARLHPVALFPRLRVTIPLFDARVTGCLAGGALAALFLLVGQGSMGWLLVGTVVGVVIGRHIENGSHSLGYTGTQFVLGVLVTLVPDSYAHAEIKPALSRLAGILIGVGMLEPVLVAWHLIAPSRKSEENQQG